MERIEALIHKLKEQYGQQADPSRLLGTVELLRFELSRLQQNGQPGLGTAKVAVQLPASPVTIPATVPPGYEKYLPAEEKPVTVQVQAVQQKEPELQKPGQSVSPKVQAEILFDPMNEIPTFSHQPARNELNDQAGTMAASLNDQLAERKTELMEVLKEAPVKDLRKAIGINDRFLFISELFRGDEAIYERSIKTINNFSIYAEAEFWISRELKTKLGWVADSEAVLHFDQLVKRRFS